MLKSLFTPIAMATIGLWGAATAQACDDDDCGRSCGYSHGYTSYNSCGSSYQNSCGTSYGYSSGGCPNSGGCAPATQSAPSDSAPPPPGNAPDTSAPAPNTPAPPAPPQAAAPAPTSSATAQVRQIPARATINVAPQRHYYGPPIRTSSQSQTWMVPKTNSRRYWVR